MTYLKCIALLYIVHFVNSEAPIVNTTQGLVRGLTSDEGDYFMYLGIPYAEVDPRNPFGPASPAKPFQGIFDAKDDSAMCYQIRRNLNRNQLAGSLDCLHLNVFTPTRTSAKGLPVLLFIHGGAFEMGTFGRSTYGPKFLVRHDVILVSFNYRLGIYGYMCTESSRVPGNQAFRDQLLALQWVNENIANFGGDPTRVTLSGNSAGGMSIDLHIISPYSPKLFQQAILQSGVAFLPSYPRTVKDSPLILANHFGFETSSFDLALDFLADLNPLDLIMSSRRLGLQFRPCIESPFEGVEPFLNENWVTKEFVEAAKDLNIIIGFNENEALGLLVTPNSDLTNTVNASLEQSYSIDQDGFQGITEVEKFFFGDEVLDKEQFKNVIDLRSDTTFVHTSIRSMERHLKSGVKNMCLYLFSYDGERNLGRNRINATIKGAVHGDENGYLYDVSFLEPPNEEDQLTIDRMTKMWTNFVKYGDPTPEKTTLLPVKWKSVTPNSPHHYILIDDDLEARSSPYNERMAFWNLFVEVNEELQKLIVDNK